MRAIGIGILGLIGGLLLAVILQDLLAPLLIDDTGSASILGKLLGTMMPAFGIVGTGLAIWIDRRRRRNVRDRGSSRSTPDRYDDR